MTSISTFKASSKNHKPLLFITAPPYIDPRSKIRSFFSLLKIALKPQLLSTYHGNSLSVTNNQFLPSKQTTPLLMIASKPPNPEKPAPHPLIFSLFITQVKPPLPKKYHRKSLHGSNILGTFKKLCTPTPPLNGQSFCSIFTQNTPTLTNSKTFFNRVYIRERYLIFCYRVLIE